MTNFKIFPASLINNQKVPLIRGWNELASNDPNQIKAWQEQFRDRISFWGIPCGEVNGIFVLDIDVKGVNGWDSLRRLGYQIPNTLRQDTPTGGSHFFFKAIPGKHYPNSVNAKLGLDTRGDRGWVAFYNFVNSEPILDAPDWLFKLAPEAKPVDAQNTNVRLAPEIATGIFESAIDNVRNAAAGESNNILNIEAYRIGQLVGASAVTREFAEAELFKAAKDRGKPDYEAKATIKSGIDGGLKNPITCPFPVDAPEAAFKLPEVPGLPERWTPRYLTRADLLNTSKLKKPQLFKDWSSEDIQITTADGGTGKTTLKLYEAVCLALGDRFLGFENMQRGKTLFITGEDTDLKLAAILGAIMNQMGLFAPGEENKAKVDTITNSILIKKDADLCLISKDRQGFLHANPAAMERVMQAVDDIKPKMIVFDPIASFWGSESMLNDMNKAVTKFMSELVDKSKACVDMINHMGKSSSATKDMSQFAGRGGSGLPSNSRVSRVLRSLPPEEYTELTGMVLEGDDSAMLCNVNKYSDGSPLFNKPFIIIRTGYLFRRVTLSQAKTREIEKQLDDKERIFAWVKQQRNANKYCTRKVVIGQFMNNGSPMSEARIKRALDMLEFEGHLGEKIKQVDNPDLTIKDKALIIVSSDGQELS